MFVIQFTSNLKITVCIHLFTDIHTHTYILLHIHIHCWSICVIYFIQDPPPINDVTASTNRTPSDLSGFDIFIMWTVSGLCTCKVLLYLKILYKNYCSGSTLFITENF